MKRNIILITLSLLIFTNAYSQVKKKNNNSKSKPEIDRLKEKYKNSPTITIFTSHEDLTGNVEVNYNVDNKPESIIISGDSKNKDAVAEFISTIIAQKKKHGYVPSDGRFEPTDAHWIKETMLGQEEGVNFTFKKGKLIFKVKGGWRSEMGLKKNLYGEMETTSESIYWFRIETIDYSRKGGKKATKFDF